MRVFLLSHVDHVLSRDVCCNTERLRKESDPSGDAGGCHELGCRSGACGRSRNESDPSGAAGGYRELGYRSGACHFDLILSSDVCYNTERSKNDSDPSGAASGCRELGCISGAWCVDDDSQQFLDYYLCHRHWSASPCRLSHVDLVLSRDVCCNIERLRNEPDPSGAAGGYRELGRISDAWSVDVGSHQFLDDYHCHRHGSASPCRLSHVDLVLSHDARCNTRRSRNESVRSGVVNGCCKLGCKSGACCSALMENDVLQPMENSVLQPVENGVEHAQQPMENGVLQPMENSVELAILAQQPMETVFHNRWRTVFCN
ncbi:hypothetical protein AMTR_s00002p00239340 [Amborella trichopoda]|uniref:Uncharacterized protein n=1 Tax=Amborella trichopoda TaxID=13333 RepID=W1NUC8_AMBTC|nr:hypothetical protein AMTR_s00002p00239340 [Amborella trichopoda]